MIYLEGTRYTLNVNAVSWFGWFETAYNRDAFIIDFSS